MYYRSGTSVRCCIGAGQTLQYHNVVCPSICLSVCNLCIVALRVGVKG